MIAEGLTGDGILSPSAHDRARNRHRTGIAWAKSAIRVVLTNPRYTGRQVWNKQRKDEVLIDINDVALGHETRQRWNDAQQWIWSAKPVRDALVSPEDFARVQELLAAKQRRELPIVTAKRTRHPYQLRGLLFCGLCQRRMQGTWNNSKPHYRCVYPSQYGLANHTEHPRSVYVREELVTPPLDRWLLRALDPHRLPRTIEAMADAQNGQDAADQTSRREDARRIITDCDHRLARYRAALEAGTDPALIAAWTAEVNATRVAAQAQLRATAGRTRMSKDEINSIVQSLGSILKVLMDADPLDKADLYAQVGLHLTYQPGQQTVIAEVRTPAIMYEGLCRRIDTNRFPTAASLGG